MANKSIFSAVSRMLPKADTLNRAGAPAFAYDSSHALAQIAMTGTFNAGFYGGGETQLQDLLKAANEVDTEFLAQTAVYARCNGRMKDTPAVLLAILSVRDTVHAIRRCGPYISWHGCQTTRSGLVDHGFGLAASQCSHRKSTVSGGCDQDGAPEGGYA